MPSVDLTEPPTDVTKQLNAVRTALDRVVPTQTDTNLLVGTWNIRAFDRVHPSWHTADGDSPIRDHSNVAVVAEIVRRFDVVAIQEVRRGAEAFLTMMSHLGPDWAFLVSDVTEGDAGNRERLGFVYNTTRLKPSGLACEIVLPPTGGRDTGDDKPTTSVLDQFARNPYAVSFLRGDTRFTLVTLHVVYGKTSADRAPELRALARWLADWSARKDIWGENLMALGDLNIDRRGDLLYEAFASTGLRPPDALNHVPRTIFDDPDPAAPPDRRHFYDQIAWFTTGRAALSLPNTNAGTFDFTANLVPAASTQQLSWRISDHFPLWVEFRTVS